MVESWRESNLIEAEAPKAPLTVGLIDHRPEAPENSSLTSFVVCMDALTSTMFRVFQERATWDVPEPSRVCLSGRPWHRWASPHTLASRRGRSIVSRPVPARDTLCSSPIPECALRLMAADLWQTNVWRKLSGIVGKVLIGPRCPVVSTQFQERCKDKPYRATIVVKTRDGLPVVTRVTSDRDGHFRILLPPGTYLLEPLRGGSPFPYGKQLKVTVLPGQFTDVTAQYDTGIR